MTVPADEETPLLPPRGVPHVVTPLPWFQLSIVLFLQLAEPLTSQVIYPFAPQLIRDIGITKGKESRVGYYVGLMQSLFFLTQAFTVLQWSRLSDHIGRRPVIMTGLFGLSVSMYSFGLSTTFWGLVLSRSLNGALNGNIGVFKSMVAELTDSTNISQAYAYIPIAWCTGSMLGPVIGGSLAKPTERFPALFGQNELLRKYPYFLPCAVPATFSIFCGFITCFFLKETVSSPKSVAELLKPRKKAKACLPSHSDAPAGTTGKAHCNAADDEKPLPLRLLLTPRVTIAAANYASLALVDIAFRAIQPLFFSTPIDLGGLGLSPSAIGKVLSIIGILNGVFQVFFFAKIHTKVGSKNLFTVGIASAYFLFASFPVCNYIARAQGYCTWLWAVIGLQIVGSILLSLCFGVIFIFISAASPNRASLGATNGLCQMAVSVMRAIGPAVATSLFSFSIDKGYVGGHLVYIILEGMVCVSMVIASLLPR